MRKLGKHWLLLAMFCLAFLNWNCGGSDEGVTPDGDNESVTGDEDATEEEESTPADEDTTPGDEETTPGDEDEEVVTEDEEAVEEDSEPEQEEVAVALLESMQVNGSLVTVVPGIDAADPLEKAIVATGQALVHEDVRALFDEANMSREQEDPPELGQRLQDLEYCIPALRRIEGHSGYFLADFNVCHCKGNMAGLRGVMLIHRTADGVVFGLPEANTEVEQLADYAFPEDETSQWSAECTREGNPAGQEPGTYPDGDPRNDWRLVMAGDYYFTGALRLTRAGSGVFQYSVNNANLDGTLDEAPEIAVQFTGNPMPEGQAAYVDHGSFGLDGTLSLSGFGPRDLIDPNFFIALDLSTSFTGSAKAFLEDPVADPPEDWPTNVHASVAEYCAALVPDDGDPLPDCQTTAVFVNRTTFETELEQAAIDLVGMEYWVKPAPEGSEGSECVCPNHGGEVRMAMDDLEVSVTHPPLTMQTSINDVFDEDDLQLYGRFPITIDVEFSMPFYHGEAYACETAKAPYLRYNGVDRDELIGAKVALEDAYCSMDWTLKVLCGLLEEGEQPSDDEMMYIESLGMARETTYNSWNRNGCNVTPELKDDCYIEAALDQKALLDSTNVYLECNNPCDPTLEPSPETNCDDAWAIAFGKCSQQCSGDQICNPLFDKCVDCTNDDHCDDPTPYCDRILGRCYACVTDEHCCEGVDGECEAVCTAAHTCRGQGCRSSDDCTGSKVCDIDTGDCVDCLVSQDCTSPLNPVCVNMECVACSENDPGACDSDETCTDNACVSISCTEHAQCARDEGGSDTPICDTANGKCVVCVPATTEDPDTALLCADERKICADVSGVYGCTGCTNDDQCARDNPDMPVCMGGRCSECDAQHDCPLGADSEAPICDLVEGLCRACVEGGITDECPWNYHCDAGKCLPDD